MITLNSRTFFCKNQIHPASDCRCPEPVETFASTPWDRRDKIFATAVVFLLAIYIYLGVTQ